MIGQRRKCSFIMQTTQINLGPLLLSPFHSFNSIHNSTHSRLGHVPDTDSHPKGSPKYPPLQQRTPQNKIKFMKIAFSNTARPLTPSMLVPSGSLKLTYFDVGSFPES
jgi:hypothetical protein